MIAPLVVSLSARHNNRLAANKPSNTVLDETAVTTILSKLPATVETMAIVPPETGFVLGLPLLPDGFSDAMINSRAGQACFMKG
jgi:hypothetical protein